MLQATASIFKVKRCKGCEDWFTPVRRMQSVCGWPCGLKVGAAATAKKLAREAKALQRKERAELKARKEAIKPRSHWQKEAQREFNAWIRARDSKLGCISCDRTDRESWDAGHYLTVGARPELRFDERNCHKQCIPCNQHLHGNLIAYRIGLVARHGSEVVAWLEGPHEPKHYTTEALKEMAREYRAKAKQLKEKT